MQSSRLSLASFWWTLHCLFFVLALVFCSYTCFFPLLHLYAFILDWVVTEGNLETRIWCKHFLQKLFQGKTTGKGMREPSKNEVQVRPQLRVIHRIVGWGVCDIPQNEYAPAGAEEGLLWSGTSVLRCNPQEEAGRGCDIQDLPRKSSEESLRCRAQSDGEMQTAEVETEGSGWANTASAITNRVTSAASSYIHACLGWYFALHGSEVPELF